MFKISIFFKKFYPKLSYYKACKSTFAQDVADLLQVYTSIFCVKRIELANKNIKNWYKH